MNNTKLAIRSLKNAIENLTRSASYLPIDSPMRMRLILRRQDIEDLLTELESE